VGARSKALTVFARSNTKIVGLNFTRIMDVCVRLFCICVVLCVGNGLSNGRSHAQGVQPTVYRIKKLKNCQVPRGCRVREKESERESRFTENLKLM
jgi:hypothetical protein